MSRAGSRPPARSAAPRPASRSAHVDLAARRGAHRRPGRGAPVDDRVRQLAAAGRAAERAAQRDPPERARGTGQRLPPTGRGAPAAGHGPVRRRPAARRSVLARAHHGSVSKEQRALDRGGPQGRPAAGRGRDRQPRARHRHGRGRPGHPGRVAAVGGQRPAAGRPGRPPGRRGLRGVMFPKYRGDLVQTAVVAERMRAGAIEALRVPAQPARRAGPAGRRDGARWTPWHGRRRCYDAGAPGRAVRRARRERVRGRARHAGRPLPERRVRRAAAAAGLGPRRRHADRPARRAAAGRHQRRHHPRPRAVRRLPGRREASPGSASSTRRWSTSRGSATSSPSARPSWRIEDITHDRVLVSPAPGQPGPAAVLEGRHARPAGRARPGARRVRPRARRPRRRRRPAAGCWPPGLDDVGGRQPARLPATSSARPPATCPTTARSWSSGSATSSATGGSSMHSPFGAQVHAPWALARRRPAARAVRRRRAGDARRRRHRAAAAGHRVRRTTRRAVAEHVVVFDARRGRAAGHRRGRRLGAVRLPVPRVRGPRPAAAAAQPRPAHAAVAAAAARPPSCSSVASDYGSFPIVLETMRECLQDVFDVPGLVGLMRDVEARARCGSSRSRPSSRRRSPGRCCSATSRSSSTRATRRWPSGGPPRCRWTRRCSPSCSAAGHGELRELLDPDVKTIESAPMPSVETSGSGSADGSPEHRRDRAPARHRERRPRGRQDRRLRRRGRRREHGDDQELVPGGAEHLRAERRSERRLELFARNAVPA